LVKENAIVINRGLTAAARNDREAGPFVGVPQRGSLEMSNSDVTVPVSEEQLTVETRRVPTGKVRVETRTETLEETAEAELETSEVEVVRVPIDMEVDSPPPIRSEGDVTIIPVIEERLVVSRRLVLKEEIHIRRRSSVETVQLPVSLRKQKAIVTRGAYENPEEPTDGKL
jgi:uncharacterized protein (TIGR02271 family)